jgi:PAS domain S-box-containing protein
MPPEVLDESERLADSIGYVMESTNPILEMLRRNPLLQTLLDSLTDLFFVKDLQGRYVVLNAAHARFLGEKSAATVVGRTAFDFFPPELARRYHADDVHVMESGCESVNEYEPSVDRTGKSRTVVRTKRPLRDTHGTIIGLIGTAQDVTERLRAEESLRIMQETLEQQVADRTAAAEQRSQELSFQKFALDQSAIVAATDARGRITYVNDKFCEISGYAREELLGMDHRKVNSGLHPKEFFKEMYSTISAGRVWHGEIRNRAKTGAFYWVDTTIVPVVDKRRGRTVKGYVAIRQDITLHKEAEAALKKRTSELEAAIESAERSNRELGFQKYALDQHAIVAVTDARGHITYVNDKFCEISKYTREELIGQDHRIVNSGLHPKEFFKQMYATIAKGNVWHGEIRNRAKDGSLYWVDTTIVPVTDQPGGYIKGYVAIRADITGWKETQQHLQAAKESAESASQSKGEFLANMSHEIRTPMTAIIGYADLLAAGECSAAERLEFVQTIRRNGEHLLSLINDLLDLSKVEAGKLGMEAVSCDPRQIVTEVETSMRMRANAKGIEFAISCDGGVPRTVFTDPTRLRQVLFNLVSNAVKFTDKGEVRVHVSFDRGQQMLQYDVTDTGIGLSEEQQRVIFKPFAQADNSTTRRFGGTGLGLALSRRLVEMMGGQLTFVSELGVGSTFSITLRNRKAERTESSGTAQPPGQRVGPTNISASHPEDAAQIRGRLLLVEDGADNRRLVTIYLQAAGLTVECAENGRDAIDMVTAAREASQPYDVILMDMQMPVMDGYHATRELRRRGISGTPIIAFTAHALEGERAKCLAAGCDDYSTKPVDPDALIRTIARQLNRAAAATLIPAEVGPADPVIAIASAASQPSKPAAPLSSQNPVLHDKLTSDFADNEAVRRVLPAYVAGLPAEVSRLQQQLASHRMEELRRTVHQLKGSGGGYGFPKITLLAGIAESLIDAGCDNPKVVAAVTQLCALLRSVEGYDIANESARLLPAEAGSVVPSEAYAQRVA